MTDDLVKQALAELGDVVRCRCHEAYTGRGMHDPDCQCDSTDAVKTVSEEIAALQARVAELQARVAELEAALATARQLVTHAATELAQSAQDMSAMRAERALHKALAAIQEGRE